MLDKLRLILYLILIFIGLIALLYIAPIFFIVSIIILWMGIKDLDKRENKKDYDINNYDKLVEENKLVIDEYNIKISDDYIYLSNDILCNFLGINYQIEKNINK